MQFEQDRDRAIKASSDSLASLTALHLSVEKASEIHSDSRDLLPDPSWSISEQLEFTVRKLGEKHQLSLDLEVKLTRAQGQIGELEKALAEFKTKTVDQQQAISSMQTQIAQTSTQIPSAAETEGKTVLGVLVYVRKRNNDGTLATPRRSRSTHCA
jgi:septal ring factor EnvC (AmiA/AmiB activator)